MTVEIRGSSDETLEAIASALEAYQADHPDARITMYRQGPYSIHVRLIDPGFESMSRGTRIRLAWSYLARLTEEQQADVNTFLLRTPEEIQDSIANDEFEDSIPPIRLEGVKTD